MRGTELVSRIADPLQALAVPIESLTQDPANARKHGTKNLDAIKASLAKFGQRKPIVVQRAGMVVRAGNGTLQAAKALGWTEIAAVKADLCFTSPPYGQQRDYTEEGKAKVADWDGLMRGVFAKLPMADAGQVLVNLGMIHRDGEWIPYWDGWIAWMREQGWRRFGWYVWDKLSGMPGDWNGRLAPAHEFIWHFNKQSVYPEKYVECKDSGRVVAGRTRGVDGVLRVHTSTKRGDAVQSHKIHDNVFRCGTSKGQQIDHPATFPVALPEIAMRSWPGTVYEPFCGSGTTLIAAEQLGRKCYGMEIGPTYCDVIVQRWETLTGKKAVRPNG